MLTTSNTTAFLHAQQYSSFILGNLHDGLLPSNFYRNVTDFAKGSTLNIKTIGTVSLQEGEENVAPTFNPIDSGNVTLAISEYPADAWYITDDVREDNDQMDTMHSTRAAEATRAFQEYFETKFLAASNAAQVAGDANLINGFAHRIGATGTNQTIELIDLIKLKLAFDKANAPAGGRILMIDPVVAATLDQKFQNNYSVDRSPMIESILETGFARDHQFVMNIMGFNIMTSNRLPRISSETVGGVTVTDGVANIAMSIADDTTRPMMAAWRRMPTVEGGRNKDLRRDEFNMTARFGVGPQRVDTLGVILTDAAAIA